MAKQINFVSNERVNIPSMKTRLGATKMQIVPSANTYEDGKTHKYFYAFDDDAKTVINGKEIYGTRGPVSKKLAERFAAGDIPKQSEITFALTAEEGSSNKVWMLVSSNSGNAVASYE